MLILITQLHTYTTYVYYVYICYDMITTSLNKLLYI